MKENDDILERMKSIDMDKVPKEYFESIKKTADEIGNIIIDMTGREAMQLALTVLRSFAKEGHQDELLMLTLAGIATTHNGGLSMKEAVDLILRTFKEQGHNIPAFLAPLLVVILEKMNEIRNRDWPKYPI